MFATDVLVQEGKSAGGESEDDIEDDDLEEDDSGKPLTTTYELNDTLYAEAQLETQIRFTSG